MSARISPHNLHAITLSRGCVSKYRGFLRLLRCLTIHPLVARPADDGLASGTFKAALRMTLHRWNPAGLCDPLLPDLLHRIGHIVVPVENRQVLHYIKSAARSWRTNVADPDFIGGICLEVLFKCVVCDRQFVF